MSRRPFRNGAPVPMTGASVLATARANNDGGVQSAYSGTEESSRREDEAALTIKVSPGRMLLYEGKLNGKPGYSTL